MALKNHTHEELGNVILDTDTNKFVTGAIGCTVASFIELDGGRVLYRAGFDSHEDWMRRVEEVHAEIVAELEADGFAVEL